MKKIIFFFGILIISCSKEEIIQNKDTSHSMSNSLKEDIGFEIGYENDKYSFETKKFIRKYSTHITEAKVELKEETIKDITEILRENIDKIDKNKEITEFCGDKESANSTYDEIQIKYNDRIIKYIFVNDIDVDNTERNKDICFEHIFLYKIFSKIKKDLKTNEEVLSMEKSDIYIE